MIDDRILNSSEIVYPPVGRHDPEDCEACSVVEEPCLYHEGFNAGFALALKLIEGVAKDPDYAAEHYLRQPAETQH